MEHKTNISQLSFFGLSSDGLYFTSARWGVLKFFPDPKNNQANRCRRCLLRDWRTHECTLSSDERPCKAEYRKDRSIGYFSIHQFPSL